jgi:P4 family phage/plasmid primase-like protien
LGLVGRKEHTPSDYATKVTSVAPGEKGAQIWQDAIGMFFCGDIELMEYVQQIVGLAAVGKVYVESLIIAYGDGRNGKSTFWNTIARVLGTYSGNISADTLTVGCKRNVKPELAEAKGKRMLIAAELDEGMRLNTSLIKQLCSTDAVQAEKKYKDPFHFTPSHTLVLYTNHLPRVGANDPGTWRRLLVIPFDAVIEGNSDIKNYSDYLFEEAGPAVLAWVIEGAQKVIQSGFHLSKPSCVERAIDAYRDNNDWLGHFLDDCCLVDKSYKEKSGELYNAYRAYAVSTGEYVRSTTDFYSALELRGFIKRKTKKGMVVEGLMLLEGREFLA